MNRQNIFPVMAMSDSATEPAVSLEGQKVVFDKKVSMLPADIKKERPSDIKRPNGKSER
jgi:hypothetical protein